MRDGQSEDFHNFYVSLYIIRVINSRGIDG